MDEDYNIGFRPVGGDRWFRLEPSFHTQRADAFGCGLPAVDLGAGRRA